MAGPADPKDVISATPIQRVMVTNEIAANVNGQQWVWSVASLAWQRMSQPVLSTDNLAVTLTIPASVNIGNIPAVTQSGGPWTTVGSVWVSSLPSVSIGNIPAVSQSGAWNTTATVNFGLIPTVSIGFPSVNIGNIPAVTQSGAPWTAVGSVWISSIPTVSVGNIPAVTQSAGPWTSVATVNAGSVFTVNVGASMPSVNIGSMPSVNGLVTETRPASPTVTRVDYSTISDTDRSVTVLAANTSRRGATVKNATDTPLRINEGATASPVAYTDIIEPGRAYVLTYPACTALLSIYLPQIPIGDIFVTERV